MKEDLTKYSLVDLMLLKEMVEEAFKEEKPGNMDEYEYEQSMEAWGRMFGSIKTEIKKRL